MTSFLRVSAIVVSYNSAERLGRCLASLSGADEVIVVDNASDDASAQLARRLGARVVANAANIGFGAACNRGAAVAAGDVLLFVNPDAELKSGCLQALLRAAHAYPEAGALGARLVDENGVTRFQPVSFMEAQWRPHMPAAKAPRGDCCVGFLSGAALMVRHEAFMAVAGFDERIFLYYEDDDLCFRLRRAGWQLVFVPEAEVVHAKGQSSRKSMAGIYRRSFSMARSRIYLSEKYGLPFNGATHLRRALLRLLRSALLGNADKAVRHAAMFWAYAQAVSSRARRGTGEDTISLRSKNIRKININF